MTSQNPKKIEASFSSLILSLGSSTAMALGLSPENTEIKKDLNMARFNIELLKVLQEKTKGNLSEEESQLLVHILSDLQIKYVEASK